jgi:hypothetical protein
MPVGAVLGLGLLKMPLDIVFQRHALHGRAPDHAAQCEQACLTSCVCSGRGRTSLIKRKPSK